MNILLIDDEAATCESLGMFLRELGHNVTTAGNGAEGLELFERDMFHLVFTDLRMPKMDGLEFLRRVKTGKKRMVDIVIVTGHGDIDSAVTAIREGAYDYLQKPVNIDELAIIVERVAEHLDLKITNEELTERFEENVRERVSETERKLEDFRNAFRKNSGIGKLAIHSKKLDDIFMLAEKLHHSPATPVLIEGETGTGKELLARYIHFGPEVDVRPFVPINCAAIPSELFESELFGHESGSFTGSGTSAKQGQFEVAEDGTVLLDEIGDMPLPMQVKLLRVLEDREFCRVGGVKRHEFRARVIASTNKSLDEEVNSGQFRSDLYHRLNVGYIRIPPLRERREEIAPLAAGFFEQARERHGKREFKGISPDAMQFLIGLPWPGNVRQLENAIERVVLLHDGPDVEVEHLRFLAPDSGGKSHLHGERGAPLGGIAIPPGGLDLDKLVNDLVEEAMRMADGSKTSAAKLLNISPRTISRRLERSGGTNGSAQENTQDA